MYRVSSEKLLITKTIINIPCAFHNDHTISHFCQYTQCLLPLCKLCIPIHRKQHSNIPEPIALVPIDKICQQTHQLIQGQQHHLNEYMQKIEVHFLQNSKNHQFLKNKLILEQERIIKKINRSYDELIYQIDGIIQQNFKWFLQFQKSYQKLKEQLYQIDSNLNNEKMFRSIILWHKIKINTVINQAINIASEQQEYPDISKFQQKQFDQLLKRQRKIKLLLIEGDKGSKAVHKALKAIICGQQNVKLKQGISRAIYHSTSAKRLLKISPKES